MKKFNVAIVGATGMVGNKFLEVMEERLFSIGDLYLFASLNSAGKRITAFGKDYEVIPLTREAVEKLDGKIDFALFSAGGAVSREYAPIFKGIGAVVVDNSSCWRMFEDVPLVVPEVNPEDAFKHHGIIANPNCSTIQAVVALKPLYDKFGVKRIVFSTYQAVSGAGVYGVEDLKERRTEPKKFARQIFDNVLPHIDAFEEDGYTKEEHKMINETRKILHDDNIRITATTVRVPVYYGHSESINVEFIKPCTLDAVKTSLENFRGLVVQDDPVHAIYPLPIYAEGRDEVFVGRIRLDGSVESGINMWVVADNIRKGAATNAVQIVELLIGENPMKTI